MSELLDAETIERRLHLWFFRDLSTDQRLGLFRLCGYPVAEMQTSAVQALSLRHLLSALASLSTEPMAQEGGEDWRDDPSNDDRWNAGVNYAIERLCDILSIDPKSISWDAATETVDGDVMSVICNALVKAYGDEWSGNPRETAVIRSALAPSPAPAQQEGGSEAEAARVRISYALYGEGNDPGHPLHAVTDALIALAVAALQTRSKQL